MQGNFEIRGFRKRIYFLGLKMDKVIDNSRVIEVIEWFCKVYISLFPIMWFRS